MPKVLSDDELQAVVAELSGRETAAAVTKFFCANWPNARTVLKLIGQASSSWVKLAVAVVLKIGNALYARCPTGR